MMIMMMIWMDPKDYLPIVYDSMIMITLITTSLIHLYYPLY